MRDGASINASRLAPADLGLYAVPVFVWGTSWIALKAQLGEVSPEVSTLWRFLLAAPLMWLWAAARGDTLAYPAADHRRFAVVFSLVSILNLLLGAAFLGQPIVPRVAVGGVLGAAGIALLYSPQIAGGFERGALVGLAFCLAGTLSFCAGNLVSTAIQRRGVPLLAATAWGMTYGVAALAAIVLVRGQPLIVEWTPRYLGATLYLALFASVVAFASYLTLLRRIGAARAGYATVLFPIVALAVSTLAEGYRWTLAAILGAALALAGNVLVLRR